MKNGSNKDYIEKIEKEFGKILNNKKYDTI